MAGNQYIDKGETYSIQRLRSGMFSVVIGFAVRALNGIEVKTFPEFWKLIPRKPLINMIKIESPFGKPTSGIKWKRALPPPPPKQVSFGKRQSGLKSGLKSVISDINYLKR